MSGDAYDEMDASEYCKQFGSLLTNWVFLFVTFSLCSVFFVVTGIQFWSSAYMIKILHADKTVVMLVFTGCCLTGPIVGVTVGSYLSDANGGYKGKNLLKAI